MSLHLDPALDPSTPDHAHTRNLPRHGSITGPGRIDLTDGSDRGTPVIDLRTADGTPLVINPTDEQRYRNWAPAELEAGLVMHETTSGEWYERGERFVYGIYRDSGFCAESPREYVEELEPWRHMGLLHVLADGDEPLAVVRTTVANFEELPISQFASGNDVPAGRLMEVGSFCVTADLRSSGASHELQRVAIRRAVALDVEAFVFEVDAWLYDLLLTVTAFPLRRLGPTHQYMGGDVIPTVVDVRALLESVLHRRPRLYRWMTRDYSPAMFDRLDLPILIGD